jgi:4,5-DOPA dioxygenase extradiol
MMTLGNFKGITSRLEKKSDKMPVLFVGHGSPMNGIEDNEFSQSWKTLGEKLPKPKAVLVISAHWLTKGTFITATPHPATIHDFGGFPQALYEVEYPAKGSPEMATATKDLIRKAPVELDYEWGLDHGSWTILRYIFPQADIPVYQLSIDFYKSAEYQYELGKELAQLREKGILIVGSGNLVHNLRMVAWPRMNEEFSYGWSHEINETFKQLITGRNHKSLIQYEKLGEAATLAVPTPDHFYPLLYALALQGKNEEATLFNDKLVGGSLSMTSVLIN